MLRILFLFFFLSGFCALIYEVAWVRELTLTLGSSAQATSTVLAVFLSGLAVGAYAGGKIADGRRNALAVYGYLEICVGLSVLLVSALLSQTNNCYILLCQTLGPATVPSIRLLLAVVLLLLPTCFMGATLPALVQYLEYFKESAQKFSLLYGANTLGAAVGSMTACFIGFTFIGVQSTIFCAAAINVIIGGFSIALSRTQQREAATNSEPQSASSEPLSAIPESSSSISEPPSLNSESASSIPESASLIPDSPSQIADQPSPTTSPRTAALTANSKIESGVPLSMLCAISFLIGFTALSYEVLWIRILRAFLTSLTYAFTITVSMFLLGLAVGSFIANGRLLARLGALNTRPYLTFSVAQYLSALFAAASLWLMASSFNLYEPLNRLILTPLGLTTSGPLAGHLMFMLVVSLVSIFLPAIFIGMLFPMIGTLAVFRKQHAASNVGLIYAVNTVGCIIGSLTCGLILMPTIGSFAALQWIVRLSTLTGILACCYAEKISPKLKAALLILPAFLAMAYSSAPIRDILPKGTSLLAHGEDTTGMMKVVLIPRDQEIQLVLNGNCLAASSPISCRYMRLLGNLPLLLHKKPENVLVGCFGTGTTCGAVALDPSVKHVDLVELSNMVLSVSPLFRKTNYDVLLNPKVSVHVNDVRNFLLTTKQKYDVVTFEPPPPTEAGVVNLYTEEFYQLLSQRINPDGIICQWIPMHQESSKLWKMMISAARSVFPYVSVWLPDNKEAVLIASAQPITMDFARMQDRLKSAPILQSSLQDVGLGSPMALLSTYIGSGEDLDKFIDNSLPITDNFPRLEFFLSYAGIPATELEVEKMGHADLLRLVAENRKQKGFDEAEFWKQWQAVHLLRQIESAGSNQQADQCIDLARTLVPGSKWLEYVDSHRDRFYRRDDASWIHGP